MAVTQQKPPVFQRGVIVCSKCATPITVRTLNALADEFSVRCPKCGHRDHYRKRAVVIEEAIERRKKPRQ